MRETCVRMRETCVRMHAGENSETSQLISECMPCGEQEANYMAVSI